MTLKEILLRGIGKTSSFALYVFFHKVRIIKYRLLSNNRNVIGKPVIAQPVLFAGGGRIVMGEGVQLGWNPSPFLYSGYIFIAALYDHSSVEISDHVYINNNSVIYSAGEGITIGRNSLIGTSVEIYDSDFHDLSPDKRSTGVPKTGKISIGENVFIGSNVKILKGVSIGSGSVIGNGSVITKSIPENVMAAGNPAKVIKKI